VDRVALTIIDQAGIEAGQRTTSPHRPARPAGSWRWRCRAPGRQRRARRATAKALHHRRIDPGGQNGIAANAAPVSIE